MLPMVIKKTHIKHNLSDVSFYLSVSPKGKTFKTAKKEANVHFQTVLPINIYR